MKCIFTKLVPGFLCLFFCGMLPVFAQNTVVTYAGNARAQRFNEVLELSDGSLVVVGEQEGRNFDWVPVAPRTLIAPNPPAENIDNAGANSNVPIIGFLLHISADLQTVLSFVQFPEDAVESVTHIRTNTTPNETTGDLFISGMRTGIRRNALGEPLDNTGVVTANPDDYVPVEGYYLAKLNNNFLNGEPTQLEWAWNVQATGDHRERQPWDVGSDGKIVYAEGVPHGNGWSAVRRLRADGLGNDVVEHWRYHQGRYKADGVPVEGSWTPAFSNNAVIPESSAVIFIADMRCGLRSWTAAEYNADTKDENGNVRIGSWPMDTFYASECDVTNPAGTQAQGGVVTGYRLGATTTHRIGAITVDRRTNDMYIGSSIQSVTAGGLPDFEPMIIGFTSDGRKKWWARLYQETGAQSPPDQYIDGLGIDYSQEGSLSSLLVIGRQHGNNVFAFFANSDIALNPLNTGNSFHNNFTGTFGDIHISWIAKYRLTNGDLLYSSWSAGYLNDVGIGGPYPEPIHDGWASHNNGNPNLNTNYSKIHIETDKAGNVYVLSYARRFVTTSNAYQPQTKFADGEAAWAPQIRVFRPDLKELVYGSSLTGVWNITTGTGGNNTDLLGMAPSGNKVVVVGYHVADGAGNAEGNDIPTTNEPAWGRTTPDGETAIIARLMYANTVTADFAINPFEGTCVGETVTLHDLSINADAYNWDFDGATVNNLGTTDAGPYELTWATPGTKTLRLTVTDAFGVSSTEKTLTYEVTAPPTTAPINQTVDISAASANILLNAPAGGDFYEWRFYDLVTQDTVYYAGTTPQSHYFELRGVYRGFLRVRSGTCEVEVPLTITVTGGPGDISAEFTVNPEDACFGSIVTFDDVNGENITEWNWAFGRDAYPSTATGPGPHEVVFTNLNDPLDNGERTALLTVSNGRIERNYLYTFRVNATANATFTVAPSPATAGTGVTFTPNTNDPANAYRWNFGNPFEGGNTSTNAIGNKTYNTPGNYFVTLEVTTPEGCVSSTTQEIVVNGGDPVEPDFAITPANQTCVFNNIQVTDMSRGYEQEDRLWHFGEGAVPGGTLEGPRPDSVYWETPGTKRIVLRVDAGNGNPRTKVYSELYEVIPYPNAFFMVEGNVCSPPANLTFVPRAQPGNYYEWIFDDGTLSTQTSSQPTAMFSNSGTAQLTVTNNGCRSVMARSVKVGAACNELKAAVIVKPARQDCGEQQFIVEGFASGEVTTWSWNFNGGTAYDLNFNPTATVDAGPFVVVYDPAATGTHTIELTVTGPSGTDTIQAEMLILPE